MTVTKRQYSHLSEMGINVWQQRSTHTFVNTNNASNEYNDKPNKYLPIDSTSLLSNVLFQDVLLSINCSIGDVNIDKNTIDLGFINWCFSEVSSLTFTNNTLITPPLQSLSNNVLLKRELWQILNTKVLS